MNQQERESRLIRRLKIKLGAMAMLLALLSLTAVLILSGLATARLALAISGNYSKAAGQQLTSAEWNNLPNDFVARTGGALSAMQGVLDLGNNRVTNLAAPAANNDAATRQYVDTAVAGAAAGGDTFTRWGQTNCPVGTDKLYDGYGFSGIYNTVGGGSDPLCLQAPPGFSPGAASPTVYADNLYPLSTSNEIMPPGLPSDRMIRCAVCYKSNGTCYERWGGTTCPGAASLNFTPAYTGYALGGYGTHINQIDRHCVDNVSFDSSVARTGGFGAVWYGVKVYNNDNVGPYNLNTFLQCAVCCN